MAEQLMETTWRTALWRQFGAAIAMLENALLGCPAPLWQAHLWRDPPPPEFPPQFAEFWYVTFHALVWLDLYLSGVPEAEFAPPAPFAQGVLDSVEALPARPYTREELRAYLASTRQKCHTTLLAPTEDQARRPVEYPWSEGQPISFLELQLYTLRHVQEHAARASPLSRTARHLGRGSRLGRASAGGTWKLRRADGKLGLTDRMNQYIVSEDRGKALLGSKGTKHMTALNWPQVHTWRLSQHGLSPRFSSQDVALAVMRTGGIQAQVMSAAELALCTRVEGLSPYDVQAALFQDHTLVKTWAMRGTLHLLSARELPLYVAARNWQLNASWSAYFAEFGLTTSAQQEAFLSAIPHVLEQGPLTRQQLADAAAKHTGIAQIRDFILSESWGSPLKPSAYRGELCFGPGQGKTVTFMNPRVWIGEWQSIEPQLALQDIARRYLQAYGPATADDFRFWWGCGKTLANTLFHSLAEEVEEVEVEGWRAFALRATLPLIQGVEPVEAVHLLPLFDAYTIGAPPRGCEPLLAAAYKRQVFNLQGWTFAVVLVNGSIQGIWRTTIRRSHTVVKVNLFCSSNAAIRKGIAAEAERLSHLFEKEVLPEYESPSSSRL